MSDIEAEADAPAIYPKALYKDGQAYDAETGRHVPHQHMIVVPDAAAEVQAKADGYAEFVHEPLPDPELAEGGEDAAAQPGDADHAAVAAGVAEGNVDPPTDAHHEEEQA